MIFADISWPQAALGIGIAFALAFMWAVLLWYFANTVPIDEPDCESQEDDEPGDLDVGL